MMPPAALIGHKCTGHACYPPRPILSGGALSVRINGQVPALVGATLAPHACGSSVHPGTITAGSPTVRIGGVPVARIGDPVNCGSAIGQGSPNVFIG